MFSHLYSHKQYLSKIEWPNKIMSGQNSQKLANAKIVKQRDSQKRLLPTHGIVNCRCAIGIRGHILY